MAGNVKLMTSAGGGVVLDTATTTATDVTVKVPVTGVNNGTLVCSDSSGNVGIGTSSPAYKLSVVSSATGNVTMAQYKIATSTYKGLCIDTNDNAGWVGNDTLTAGEGILFQNTTNAARFYTNSSERMRIDSSGNLLVGSSGGNPYAAKFYVLPATNQRGIQVTQSGAGDYCVGINAANNGGTFYYQAFLAGGTHTGQITSNGTTTTYATTSDYRLKENIQPMQNALGVVAQLNPVTYTWKADGSDGQGFIAHELQAVVPDCVTGEKDAVDEEGKPVYQGIDTSFLVATLTKAIQELSAKNDALEARIAALEAK